MFFYYSIYRLQCDHDGASLVTVDSEEDEYALHGFAVANKQPLWIGLLATNVGLSRDTFTIRA